MRHGTEGPGNKPGPSFGPFGFGDALDVVVDMSTDIETAHLCVNFGNSIFRDAIHQKVGWRYEPTN